MPRIAVLLFIALNCNFATAKQLNFEPIFGPEFTFFNPNGRYLSSAGVNPRPFLARANLHLVEGQPLGSKFIKTSEVSFSSPNNWWFTVQSDPGVLEITMKPGTVAHFETYASDMQDAIFVTAANEGLFPGLFVGGGHINIGITELVSRPLLFRNFLADLLFNHVELFAGIFGFDSNNALPNILLGSRTRAALRAAIAKFDRVEHPKTEDAYLLGQEMVSALHQTRHDAYSSAWNSPNFVRSDKYVALNLIDLRSVGMGGRIELRAVRPQASMDVWVRQIRLLRNRIRYLATLTEPMPLSHPIDLRLVPDDGTIASESQLLNPPISAEDALINFRKFVEESGEKIEDHLDYVWPAWITSGEVQRFKDDIGLGCDRLLGSGI